MFLEHYVSEFRPNLLHASGSFRLQVSLRNLEDFDNRHTIMVAFSLFDIYSSSCGLWVPLHRLALSKHAETSILSHQTDISI